MKWSGYVLSAVLGGAVVGGVVAGVLEARHAEQLVQQLAQQRAFFTRGEPDITPCQKDVMQGWSDWKKSGGLTELPIALK